MMSAGRGKEPTEGSKAARIISQRVRKKSGDKIAKILKRISRRRTCTTSQALFLCQGGE